MKKNKFILITLILILIEQGIKLIINAKYLEASIPIIKNYIYFDPLFNRDYSWINSLFQLGVSKFIHIFLVAFIIIGIIVVYQFIVYKNYNTKLLSTTLSFVLAGGICSFIDKIFWDGSLDYIYIVNYFTFDLKDVYINVFIFLMIMMFIIDHQGIRTAKEDTFLTELKDYVLRKNEFK